MTVTLPLADVVEQDGELQDLGLSEVARDPAELLQAWILRLTQGLETVHEDESMLVHRIPVVGVELHQTGDPSELRDIGREDAELVHLAQRLGHAARRPEDGQEESQHAIRAAEGVVDQVQVTADGLLGIEAEIVPHLLPVPEDLQQPDRIVPEAVLLGGEDVDLPVELDEIVPDVPRS